MLSAQSQGTGKWTKSIEKSQMDDSRIVLLMLPAVNAIDGLLKVERPELAIRCKENKTDVYVRLKLPPNPELGDGITVRVRLGQDQAQSQRWSVSTSGETLF